MLLKTEINYYNRVAYMLFLSSMITDVADISGSKFIIKFKIKGQRIQDTDQVTGTLSITCVKYHKRLRQLSRRESIRKENLDFLCI